MHTEVAICANIFVSVNGSVMSFFSGQILPFTRTQDSLLNLYLALGIDVIKAIPCLKKENNRNVSEWYDFWSDRMFVATDVKFLETRK